MIKLIKSDWPIVEDILLQQEIPFRCIETEDVADLKRDDILFWDIRGFVSYYNINHINDFLSMSGKIIFVPEENYKIFSRVESATDDIWHRFIQLTNSLDSKNQLLVLIEGKLYQTDQSIKCTPIQFGYFESFDGFIGNQYNACYTKNNNPQYNYGTAAFDKPTRILRQKFYNKIKSTNIDLSSILLTPEKFRSGIDKFSVPDSIRNSYCSIIHETDVDPYVTVLSEKTKKPILLEKIWITLADCNYYSTMSSLGFDTFDDIFDLSFAYENDLDCRVDKFIDELVNLNTENFELLSRKLYKRTLENKYNFSRALSIDYHQKINTVLNLVS